MKALVFAEPRRAVVEDVDVPRHRRRRGARALAQRRHLPLGLRALRGPLHHPRLVPDHPRPRVVGRDRRGRRRRSRALRPGDRVVGECVVNNGDDHFGFTISGANAEYFVAKATWLHRLPEELSFAQGAFVEPFSVAYSASVAAGGIDASDRVAVIGGGPIGLLCVMAAATMGGRVTLVEPQAQRRALGARGRRGGRASTPAPGRCASRRWRRPTAAASTSSSRPPACPRPWRAPSRSPRSTGAS